MALRRNGFVVLSEDEMYRAAKVGCHRRIASIFARREDNKRTTKDPWQTDIEGAAAELAFAKYLGVEWNEGVDTFKAPDVGELQVRSTELPYGSLIIRPDDKNDDEIFVLVTGSCPVYRPIGWMRCGDCKQQQWWRQDAWFVPQSAPLRDLEELGLHERQG